MPTTLVSVPIILASLCIAPTQQDTEEAEENSDFQQLVINEVTAEYKTLLVNGMQIRIADMQQHLNLDKKSVRRLQLAAKGAATRTLEKYSDKLAGFVLRNLTELDFSINGRRFKVPKGADEDETEGDDDVEDAGQPKADNRVPYRVVMNVKPSQLSVNVREESSSSGSGTPGGFDYLERQKIWKDALEAVTTAEQRKRYESYRKERLRLNCISMITSAFAIEMNLTEDQADKFRTWADKQIKEVNESDIASGTEWAIRNIGRRLKPDGLDEFLAPEQVQILRIRAAAWDW